MKIKKKTYQKELKDSYWRGVEAGIRYAKERPDVVNDYDISTIRATTEKAQEVLKMLCETFRKTFDGR